MLQYLALINSDSIFLAYTAEAGVRVHSEPPVLGVPHPVAKNGPIKGEY